MIFPSLHYLCGVSGVKTCQLLFHHILCLYDMPGLLLLCFLMCEWMRSIMNTIYLGAWKWLAFALNTKRPLIKFFIKITKKSKSTHFCLVCVPIVRVPHKNNWQVACTTSPPIDLYLDRKKSFFPRLK